MRQPGKYLVIVGPEGSEDWQPMVTNRQLSTIETAWITSGTLTYKVFHDEIVRLSYAGYNEKLQLTWYECALQARALHEFLRKNQLIRDMNIVRFFGLFSNTFQCPFKNARSLQGYREDEWEGMTATFQEIFETRWLKRRTSE